MTFAFPAYHTETYRAVVQPVRLARRGEAGVCLRSPGRVREETYDKVIAARGVNLWSWGETVYVHFGSDSSYSVTSKCVVPFQCCDWGRNRKNVQKFAETLKQYL